MTTTTFDTLAYAKRLRDAGVPEPQAEAQSSALADALKQSASELATKQDVQEVRRDMKELELSLRRDIAELKADLLKWVIGLLLVQTGLFAALVKLLH